MSPCRLENSSSTINSAFTQGIPSEVVILDKRRVMQHQVNPFLSLPELAFYPGDQLKNLFWSMMRDSQCSWWLPQGLTSWGKLKHIFILSVIAGNTTQCFSKPCTCRMQHSLEKCLRILLGIMCLRWNVMFNSPFCLLFCNIKCPSPILPQTLFSKGKTPRSASPNNTS